FNLTVRDMGIGFTEQFRNVSVVTGPRQVDKVLANESTLVRALLPLPNAIPKASDDGLQPDELKKVPFVDANDKRSSGVAPADKVTDGQSLDSDSFIGAGLEGNKQGLYALKRADLFNILCLPPYNWSDNQVADFVPCGAVAGIFARTDTNRGVWKAPAGLDATLVGVPDLSVHLTDAENGELNPLGVNCLRILPPGVRVIWGSRTMQGD